MKTEIELRNATGREFTRIIGEKSRTYFFPDCSVIVKNILWINIGNSGHRLLDSDGICYYVPYGWVSLKWEVEDDAPHFSL